MGQIHRNLAVDNLGMLLLGQNRAAEAEKWLRKSAEAGDHDGENALGALLMKRGDGADAEVLFRRAASAGHRGGSANLGILLVRQGRIEEAQPWLPHPPARESESFTWAIRPDGQDNH